MEHMQGVLVASASVVGTEQRGFRCPSTRKGLRPRETGGSAQTGAAPGTAWGCVSHTTIDSHLQDPGQGRKCGVLYCPDCAFFL